MKQPAIQFLFVVVDSFCILFVVVVLILIPGAAQVQVASVEYSGFIENIAAVKEGKQRVIIKM